MSWDHIAFGRRLAEAAECNDREAVSELISELTAHLTTTDEPYPADHAARILIVLRRKRYFSELSRVADAFLANGQNEPVVRRQYAQALIEEGKLTPAIDMLRAVAADTDPADKENREARGLLGRAYKQRYVDAAMVSGNGSEEDLRDAAAAYLGVYDEAPGDPDRFWHGINGVAILERATRDGTALLDDTRDPGVVAESILRAIELRRDEAGATMWDYAVALEACIALGRNDEALEWARVYAQHPNADAFEFGSTLRQLEEVWQLHPEDEPGRRLLPLLKAALLRQEGSRLDLDADSDLAGALESLTSDGEFEAILGREMFQNLVWLEKALALAGSVARVRDSNDEPKGTAFVVRSGDIDAAADPSDELLLLTNAHVVSADLDDHPALVPAEARISFERGGDDTVYEAEVVWSSPRDQLDATLIRTQPALKNRKPVPIAARLPRPDARVYIIGHPQYQPLSYSIYDNRLLAIDSPYLHYRTPTEGGSSGSPVFNPEWELIGLHHKGNVAIPVPDDDALQAANEGLIYETIQTAAEGATAEE